MILQSWGVILNERCELCLMAVGFPAILMVFGVALRR